MTNLTKQEKRSTNELIRALLRDKYESTVFSPTNTDKSTYYTLIILRPVGYSSTVQGGSTLVLHQENAADEWYLRFMNDIGGVPHRVFDNSDLALGQIYFHSVQYEAYHTVEKPNWITKNLIGGDWLLFTIPSFPTLSSASISSNSGIVTKTFRITHPPKGDEQLYRVGLFDEKRVPVHVLSICTDISTLPPSSVTSNYVRAMGVLRGSSSHSVDKCLRIINLFLTALENRCKDSNLNADHIEYIYTEGTSTDSIEFIGNESERLGTDVFNGWFLLFALSELDMFGQGVVGACITHEVNHHLASTCRQLIAKIKEPFLCDLYKMWARHGIVLDRERMMDLNSTDERSLSEFKTSSVFSLEEISEYEFINNLLAGLDKLKRKRYDYHNDYYSHRCLTNNQFPEPSLILTQKHTSINDTPLLSEECPDPRSLVAMNESLTHDLSLTETKLVDPDRPTCDTTHRRPISPKCAQKSTFDNIDPLINRELSSAISWPDDKKSVFMLLGSNMEFNPQYLAQTPFHGYIAANVIPKLDYFKAIRTFAAYKRIASRGIPTHFRLCELENITNANYIEHCLADLEHNLKNLDSLTRSILPVLLEIKDKDSTEWTGWLGADSVLDTFSFAKPSRERPKDDPRKNKTTPESTKTLKRKRKEILESVSMFPESYETRPELAKLTKREGNINDTDETPPPQNSRLAKETMREITVCLLSISCIVHDLVGELDDCITKTQNITNPCDMPDLPLFRIPKPTFQDEIKERVSQKNVDPLCIRLLINEMCLQATKYNDRELASLVEKFSSLLYVYMKNEE